MRFSQNEQIFHASVLAFPDEASKLLDELESYVAESRIKEARISIHSLKGMSSTVGARELSERAKSLEAAFKSTDNPTTMKDNLKAELPRLRRLLQESVNLLMQYLPEDQHRKEENTNRLVSKAECMKKLEAVEQQLASFNLQILDDIVLLTDTLPVIVDHLTAQLVRLIQNLDFAAAQQVLKEIQKGIISADLPE
ncbi:Hpt domain-containing protein [Leeia sp. TBRC 13508]|uniref:Hpt domain-containing protein n=2 Tax=Leeia speluncae TaxID=2884804 RepID=A0ABS8D3X2_9NEIS|nr:Hpt domain-containing protein [Leeia speluncae]